MDRKLYWGDLHNHNSVGLFHYSKGSLERTIEIAQSHLDFFAFTGHSYWHDMPEMPNNGHLKWQEGFDHHTKMWPRVQEAIARANRDGEFVAFPAYEWHSTRFGDRSVIFPRDNSELLHAEDIDELAAMARRTGAMLIPHHVGYRSGSPPGRGANWESIDEDVSPLLEIFSEHGGAERDRGPWPYIRHTNGPRTTRNTWQHALAMGKRLGCMCSTDDHFGYPGAYGEGLTGVYAVEQTREAIWEALRARRTIGVTGDRIELAFTLNGEPMGSELPATDRRHIEVEVSGWDDVAMVEVLRNNTVIHRHFPEDHADLNDPFAAPVKCRVEFGWGPWTALGIPRIADWEMLLRVNDAVLRRYMPCFQSGPMDEQRRNVVLEFDEEHCRWQSYTSREGCFAETPTNAVVFEIEGGTDAMLMLDIDSPARHSWIWTLGELMASSSIQFTGGYPCESLLVHRLVPQEMSTAKFALDDDREGADFYYVRVTQANGQTAWSSPVWVG